MKYDKKRKKIIMLPSDSISNILLIIFIFHFSFLISAYESFEAPVPGSRIPFHRLSMPRYSNETFYHFKRTPLIDAYDGQQTFILQGRSLFEETIFQRSQGHFNRERTPERTVHAKGFTYFGTFQVTNADIGHFTKAKVFTKLNGRTRVAVRFSTQLGERGSSDTPFGEVRGMGVKFYTEDGIYDLLCINLPVFFINDPQLFVHLNHAQKRDPRSDLRNSNNLWDFISHRPETLNGITFVYSDYGMPDGFRHMPGFSVNTFRLVNKNGERFYTRFMFLPMDGIKNLNLSESFRLAGVDPDYARRDLFVSIENKHRPSWTLYIQVITVEEVDQTFTYNPFDATKLWPVDRFPPIEVGIMTLDKNVDNAFAQNEQLALNPANLVPGIEPSPDRLLLGRLFAYLDTQFYRLGANHLLIPVNRDGKKLLSERDGPLRTDGNFGRLPNYYPNSRFHDQPWLYDVIRPTFAFDLDDVVLLKADSIQQQYEHARQSYYSLTPDQQYRLHYNLAYALSSITEKQILDRMMEHFMNISPKYARGVQLALMDYEFK